VRINIASGGLAAQAAGARIVTDGELAGLESAGAGDVCDLLDDLLALASWSWKDLSFVVVSARGGVGLTLSATGTRAHPLLPWDGRCIVAVYFMG
jgi:hypothetical protein